LFVTSCIGRHFCGFSALDHDILVEIDLLSGRPFMLSAVMTVGASGSSTWTGRGAFWAWTGTVVAATSALMAKAQRCEGGGRKPAHEKKGQAPLTGDFLI
jgi:hypothetical protein